MNEPDPLYTFKSAIASYSPKLVIRDATDQCQRLVSLSLDWQQFKVEAEIFQYAE